VNVLRTGLKTVFQMFACYSLHFDAFFYNIEHRITIGGTFEVRLEYSRKSPEHIDHNS
jgi:hypothetical protein